MRLRKLLALMAVAAAWLTAPVTAGAQTPRPEYPRPQFERNEWVNLNGTWTYAFDFGQTGAQKGWQNAASFDGKITVPFCPESALSGVHHTDFINCMWYQRSLSVPQAWEGKRVLLHFGAVDYEARVFIDGRLARLHKGSGSSFSCDITPYVKAGHTHNLVVQVNDDLRSGLQTGGKQSRSLLSEGCMYTRVTGIWQTVWMEAVDPEGLKSVFATPDIDQRQLVVRPQFYAQNSDNRLAVTLLDGQKVVAKATAPCADQAVLTLPVKNMKLWSPEHPFLYTLRYEVLRGGKVVDRVTSYAGMRKVHLQGGYFYLNNKPYYQRLVLDQGYYPDGVWTAPSDEALRHDIEMSKAVGFNGARLHQKSFEERYYYWADRLGYLTWSESASWGLDVNNDLAARNFLAEWAELVERDRNHPSIVTWTPFNETWDANDSGVYTRLIQDVYHLTKAIDGTRPVNDASGDSHILTDIWSVHNYCREPADFARDFTFEHGREPYRNMKGDRWQWLARYEGQPYMLDEFGGLAYIMPEKRHGDNAWGYGGAIKDKEQFYDILRGEVEAIKACRHITGFCYTQITDVEQEQNGIYNYDRTPKFDAQRVKQIFELIPSYIEKVDDLSY